MSCEHYRQLLTGYVDEELADAQREQLESHLSACEACARELEELVAFKEHLAMLKFKEPSDAELERYWSRVYNRLERGVGWILFSLGSIILLSWGAFKLIEEMIHDPEITLWVKIGVVSLIVGIVVLFVSAARERLSVRKTDKYSREVER
jgi:predicted anti-sigma-YlaC factor YlaD